MDQKKQMPQKNGGIQNIYYGTVQKVVNVHRRININKNRFEKPVGAVVLPGFGKNTKNFIDIKKEEDNGPER
jgi:hypothetical protein